MVEITYSDDDRVAIYERVSSDDQDLETQREVLRDWTADHGLEYEAIVDRDDRYADFAISGSDPEREAFNELIDAMEDGEYDAVLTWEISRMARLGLAYQRFMYAASENDVVVSIASGPVEHVLPDGTGKLIADIMAAVYENELRDIIRRTEAGQERALREGKWVGNVPRGFRVRDGYLEVRHEIDERLEEDSDKDVTYWQVRAALKQILVEDESYSAAAADLPLTYQSLANYVDDERLLRRYIAGVDEEDDRINDALEDVHVAEWADVPFSAEGGRVGDVLEEFAELVDEMGNDSIIIFDEAAQDVRRARSDDLFQPLQEIMATRRKTTDNTIPDFPAGIDDVDVDEEGEEADDQ